jgi:hypothetical protein
MVGKERSEQSFEPLKLYMMLSKSFIHFYFPSKIFIGIKTIIRRKGWKDTITYCGRRCCSGGHLVLGEQLSHKVVKLFIADTILIWIPCHGE